MKQLIILIGYIHLLEEKTLAEKRNTITAIQETMDKSFPEELQEECNVRIKWILVPVKEPQPTKIECIYPVNITNEDVINEKINELNEKIFQL
jgi:hypothetical protein